MMALISVACAKGASKWTRRTHWQDEDHHYVVGSAQGAATEAEGLSASYADAIARSRSLLFGVPVRDVATVATGSERCIEIADGLFVPIEEIQLRALPQESFVERVSPKDGGGFNVYRSVVVRKIDVAREIERLQELMHVRKGRICRDHGPE